MTRDPRMPQDPLAFMSGVPAWLKERGDQLGAGLQGAMQVPGVEGALTGLSWLDDAVLKTPVGLAALGVDALPVIGTGGELGRSLDRTNTPWWERPKEAAHRTMGAFQQVAEDPNAPAWTRAVATVPRVAALRGEILAPLAPGVGATKGLLKGGIKGAGQELVSEVKRGTVFGQKVGSKSEGLKEFGKDFVTFGRPEARAVKQIASAIHEFRAARGIPTTSVEEPTAGPLTIQQQAEKNIMREAAARKGKTRLTFLVSDLEDSTGLTQRLGPQGQAQVLSEMQRITADAYDDYGGQYLDHTGDGAKWVFPSVQEAAAAAAAAQKMLRAAGIAVRVGISTGSSHMPAPRASGSDYMGTELARTNRVASEVHGGEVALSQDAADALGKGAPMRELGLRPLKGFGNQRVYMLDVDRAADAFGGPTGPLVPRPNQRSYPLNRSHRIGVEGGALDQLPIGAGIDAITQVWPDLPQILIEMKVSPKNVSIVRSIGQFDGETRPNVEMVLRNVTNSQAEAVAGRLGHSASTKDPKTGLPQQEVWVWHYGGGDERVVNIGLSKVDDALLEETTKLLNEYVGESGFTARVNSAGEIRTLEISSTPMGTRPADLPWRIALVQRMLRERGYISDILTVDHARLVRLRGGTDYDDAIAGYRPRTTRTRNRRPANKATKPRAGGTGEAGTAGAPAQAGQSVDGRPSGRDTFGEAIPPLLSGEPGQMFPDVNIGPFTRAAESGLQNPSLSMADLRFMRHYANNPDEVAAIEAEIARREGVAPLGKSALDDVNEAVIRGVSNDETLEAINDQVDISFQRLGAEKFNLLNDLLDTRMRKGDLDVVPDAENVREIARLLDVPEDEVASTWKRLVDEAAEMDFRAGDSAPASDAFNAFADFAWKMHQKYGLNEDASTAAYDRLSAKFTPEEKLRYEQLKKAVSPEELAEQDAASKQNYMDARGGDVFPGEQEFREKVDAGLAKAKAGPVAGTSPPNYEWKKGDRVQLQDGSFASVVEPLPGRGNVYIIRDGEKTRVLWPREKLKYAGPKVGPPGSGRVAEKGRDTEFDEAVKTDPELWHLLTGPKPEEEVAIEFTNLMKRDAQVQIGAGIEVVGPEGKVKTDDGRVFRIGAIDADLRFTKSGHLMHTGDGPVPVERIAEITAPGGAVVVDGETGPLSALKAFFSSGQEGKVTAETALNIATAGLFGLIKRWLEWRKARAAVPFEQTFPGGPDDNILDYVETATRGGRTVGENSEPALMGGPTPQPSPLVASGEGPISPGNIAAGRPPQLGPGVPPQEVIPPQGTAAELPARMTGNAEVDPDMPVATPIPAPAEEVAKWNQPLGERLEGAASNQVRRLRAITQKVRDRQAITGPEADEIVRGLEAALQRGEGDVTQADILRIKKVLEPVRQAQAMYDSAKDVNDQLAKIAKQALRMAERERNIALGKLLGLDERAEALRARIGEADVRKGERLARVQQAHEQRVTRINAAVDVALQRLAEGEANAIVRAMSDLDAAAADIENAQVTKFHLSAKNAEALARRGYLSPVDKELLDEVGFNTGKYHPKIAKRIADGIRSNRAEWDAQHKSISMERSLQDAARYVGVPIKELQAEAVARGLQNKGDVTAFMLGLRLATVDQVQKLDKMRKAGASSADMAAAYTEFQEFLLHVGGASSELGRALVSQRQVMTQKLRNSYTQRSAGGLIRMRIRDAEQALGKTITKLDQIQEKYDLMLTTLGERQAKALDAANRKLVDDTKAELDAAKVKREKLEKQLETLRQAEVNAAKRLREAVDEVRATAAAKMAADAGTIDDLKAIMELKGDNIDQLVVAVRNLHKITNGDKAISYLTNNIFSGIASQEANLFGSLFRIFAHVAETAGAEAAGNIGARFGIKAAVTPGETAATLRGIKRAVTEPGSGQTMAQKMKEFREAGQNLTPDEADIIVTAHHAMPKVFEIWIDTMLKGHGTEAGQRVAEIGRPTVWGHGRVGLAMEFFNRLNGSFDAVGRLVLKTAEEEALYLKRARESLVAEGAPVTPESLSDRFDHMLLDPPDDILTQAVRISERSTYAGKFNPFTEKVLGAINHRFDLSGIGLGETPAGRFFFAASRFTWAATVYSLETTPLGLVKAGNRLRQSRLAGAAGDVALQESLSREAARMGVRGTAGLVATVWAVNAYTNGNLIGKDHEGRGRDDSIKVGDAYIPLKYMWPISAPLIYTAHVMDAVEDGRIKEQEWPEVAMRAGLGWGEALATQPVLRSINEVIGAMKYGGDAPARLLSRWTGRAVPYSSFWRDVAQMVDAIDRDPRGSLVDMWKENLPLLSHSVNPKVNRWGEPVINKPEGALRAIPFMSLEQASNPADTAIVKLQRTTDPLTKKPYLGAISAPEDHIGGVELEPEQHAAWQTMAGEARKQALVNLVQGARFQQADPKQQATLIKKHNERAITDAKRAFAAELLKDRNPETQLKGVRIGISVTQGNYQRAKLVEQLLPVLDQNPDLAKLFDTYKQPDDLTLAQYRQAVRYLPILEKQPEFAYFNGAPIGNEEQWDQYHAALKHYNQLNKDGRKNEARIYLLRNTVLQRYMALAKRPGGKNAVVTNLKNRFPVLKYIVLPGREDEDEADIVRNPLPQARAF